MSFVEANEPKCKETPHPHAPLLIEGRKRDLGDLTVRRILPAIKRRMVGPFIFFDHIGPVVLPEGRGIDVRPHPHVHLATVTYLFEGAQVHRDSLGVEQRIEPGAVNWMSAGRGIVHSERSPADQRSSASPLHGIQAWVALPDEAEDSEPTFQHLPKEAILEQAESGVLVRLLAGEAFGLRSSLQLESSLFYAELLGTGGGTVELSASLGERAVYLVSGEATVDGASIQEHTMVVLDPDAPGRLELPQGCHAMVLGGAAVGDRHIYWNFVASSQERIEAAKNRWKNREFPVIPTDQEEFIPLPEK